MWRAFFLALGTYSCLLGAQCLAYDKLVLITREEPQPGPLAFMNSTLDAGQQKEVSLPDWAPWTLLSAGAVTLLYSFTIPKRVGNK